MSEIHVEVGDIWKEVDPRVERYISIHGLRPQATGGARIDFRTCTEEGHIKRFTVGSARMERFNGKRGGYKLHRRLPTASPQAVTF